jgi:hypothetical protein
MHVWATLLKASGLSWWPMPMASCVFHVCLWFLCPFSLCPPLLSQPLFEGSVRSPLTPLKMGLRSPLRLPKTQNVIAGVKTPCIEVFFIPLKRSWSVDVRNGLAWAIWTSAAQVMVERRAGSQIGSLTPDHKKSGIDLIPVCEGGVQNNVGKLSKRATSFLETLSQSKVGARSYKRPKSQESKPGQFRDSTLGVLGQREPFECGCGKVTQKILYGGRWWLPPSPGRGESSESGVARGLFQHRECSECELTNLLVGFECRTE